MEVEEVAEATRAGISRWSAHFGVDTGMTVELEEAPKTSSSVAMRVARPALASESTEVGKSLPMDAWSQALAAGADPQHVDRKALKLVVAFVRARMRETTLEAMGESRFGPDWSWHAAACVVAMAQNAPDRYDPATAGATFVLGERVLDPRPSYPPQKGETLLSGGRLRRAGVACVNGARRLLPDGRRLTHDGHDGDYRLTISDVGIPETIAPNFMDMPLTDLVDDEALRPAAGLCRIIEIENLQDGGLRIRIDEPHVLLASPPEGVDFGWLNMGRKEMREAGVADPAVLLPWTR